MDQYLAPLMASASSWLNSMKLPVMEGDSLALQFIGKWAYVAYDERDLILMYFHLFLSALFPIYVGCHAALKCPSSASEPARKNANLAGSEDDDEDLAAFKGERIVEGLTPSDAALLPVLASVTLGLAYILIKWLKDLTLLNKILGYYFSLIGIVGVGNIAGDALNVLTTLIFPSVWSSNGELYFVDPLLSQQFTVGPTDQESNKTAPQPHPTGKTTPLPGPLSRIALPNKISRILWTARGLLRKHWILRCYIRGAVMTKRKVRLSDVIGPIIGVATVVMYNISDRHWLLTNLMGFGFCYGGIQLMTPTTFWTGSLVLGGLFVYDIVMVFYTPLMVTVATSLDVPIKLIIPGPKRGSILGLGDIILPGIMIALALRFDIYLHYLRKRASSDMLVGSSDLKPAYKPASGLWGERFWTTSLPTSEIPENVAATMFPKMYFTASIIGYSIGMLTTIIVLAIFKQGQPALLYLVPSVLTALWGTALCRGELKLMWNYTEAEDEEGERAKDKKAGSKNDKGNTGGGNGNNSNESATDQNGSTKKASEASQTDKGEGAEQKDKKPETSQIEAGHHVFMIMLSEPRPGAKSEE